MFALFACHQHDYAYVTYYTFLEEANQAAANLDIGFVTFFIVNWLRNLQHEEKEGMYLLSLNALLEFKKLTRHITDSELTKN